MATKDKGNGADPVVEVLLRIEARVNAVEQATERGFGLMQSELREMKSELRDVKGGLASVNERLDKVIENTGGHYRDLEVRVSRLEQDFRNLKTG